MDPEEFAKTFLAFYELHDAAKLEGAKATLARFVWWSYLHVFVDSLEVMTILRGVGKVR